MTNRAVANRYEIDLTPDMVGDVAFDYDAQVGITSVAGEITAWADQSGNANNLVKGTTGPMYSAGSGVYGRVGALSLGGTEFMSSATVVQVPRASEAKTIFVVMRSTNGSDLQAPMKVTDAGFGWATCISSGNSLRFYCQNAFSEDLGAMTANTSYVATIDHDGGSAVHGWLNGVGGTAKTVAVPIDRVPTGINVMAFGQGSLPMFGAVSRVVVFREILSASNRLRFENYLRARYGV